MAGDSQDDNCSPDAVRVPFLFVPHGEAPPPGWLAAHPDAIKVPATFVPRGPAGRMRNDDPWPSTASAQPWPSDRFGHPLRPFSDYGPDERAPGEGLPEAKPGIPDLDAAVAAYLTVDAAIRAANGGLPAGFPGGTVALVDDTARAPPEQSGSSQPAMPPESRDVGIDEHDPAAPVPLVDDHGRPVLRSDGTPILRPAGLDPHMFVAAGERDRQRILAMLRAGGNLGALAAESLRVLVHLWKFDRGHSWDAQRVGGEFHQDFVDYATIAIGLYAAAAGIPRDLTLDIENNIARSSDYKGREEMDSSYKHLPTKNIRNTDLGYKLYQSRRFDAAVKPSTGL